jgi:hypothetical protein
VIAYGSPDTTTAKPREGDVILADGTLGLVLLGLWLFCIIDVITTPEGDARNLPKMVWLLLVIILVDVGAILWLVAGRDWNRRPADLPYKGNRGRGVTPAPARATNPDDDEQFLAQLRARAEEQRRRAREQDEK